MKAKVFVSTVLDDGYKLIHIQHMGADIPTSFIHIEAKIWFLGVKVAVKITK